MVELTTAPGVLTLLLAVAIVYLVFQRAQKIQRKLQQLNANLVEGHAKLSTMMQSMGDGVIATDAQACITLLNPVAETMTGWSQAEAVGQPVGVVFRAINKKTRLPSVIPVGPALAKGTIQGLANHTVLIARSGQEFDISDSCAPIRGADQQVIGAILVFRDVTQEYAVQHAMEAQRIKLAQQNDELRRSQKAVVEASALQNAIFSSANFSCIATDARGVIQIFNVGAERMLGYAATDVLNKSTPADISDPQEVVARAQALSAELRKPITPGFEALVFKASRGIEDIYELTYIRKDGGRLPVVVSVTALRDPQNNIIGYLLIGIDNTARKQAEDALRENDALLRTLHLHSIVSVTDRDGRIVDANEGFCRISGYSRDELLGHTHKVVNSGAQTAAFWLDMWQSISSGKLWRGEICNRTKEGELYWVDSLIAPFLGEDGHTKRYISVRTDITARKRVEAERELVDEALQDKNIELEAARAQAEKANLAKSDFLSSMSHELRTPLGAILGFAQLIESGNPRPTPSQKRSVDQILKAGWYLLDLINEILDLALIESGRLSMSLEPVSLAEVLNECEAMVGPQAKLRDIQLDFTPLTTPCHVQADRIRVKQVLINLLSNAIKYNRHGGEVTVTVASTWSRPGLVRISVHDTGAGLAPEQLEQLFQPFNRLGQKGKIEDGTGIGLVVSKRLVELMRGHIGVDSTVGSGSVFWFELVLTTQAIGQNPVDAQRKPAAKILPSGALQRTLLYVEDNPANLMLVEDLVNRRTDIRLLSAMDGNAGVELAQSELPDVILMDINLPGISGLHALDILARGPATAHIPVIALSANAIPRDIEKGLEAGFFRYLTKPIKIHEFMVALDEALQFAKNHPAGTPVTATPLKETSP